MHGVHSPGTSNTIKKSSTARSSSTASGCSCTGSTCRAYPSSTRRVRLCPGRCCVLPARDSQLEHLAVGVATQVNARRFCAFTRATRWYMRPPPRTARTAFRTRARAWLHLCCGQPPANGRRTAAPSLPRWHRVYGPADGPITFHVDVMLREDVLIQCFDFARKSQKIFRCQFFVGCIDKLSVRYGVHPIIYSVNGCGA